MEKGRPVRIIKKKKEDFGFSIADTYRPHPHRFRVTEVVSGGPAQQAHLTIRDFVILVNGISIGMNMFMLVFHNFNFYAFSILLLNEC